MIDKSYFAKVCLALLPLVISGCGKKEEVAALPPRPVQTIEVPAPTTTITRSFSGQLETSEGANLAFEVSGRVISVVAKQGQEYAKDVVLARLDQSDYQNSLEDARAGLTQAEQQLRRIQRLFESGNASQSQLDGVIATERSARANFNQATSRISDTSLKMPYKGRISTVDVDAQQVVNAGQSVMTVQGEGPMEFVFGVPADIVQELRDGMTVEVRLGDVEDEVFGGVITEISPGIQNNTTYGVTAAMSSKETQFRSGMAGEANIELMKPNGGSIEIPLSCVLAAPDGAQFVWTVQAEEGGKTAIVSKRGVALGMLQEEGTVSIVSGLDPGERVISRGVHRVEAGMIVRLIEIE